jgi:hypothetical protein
MEREERAAGSLLLLNAVPEICPAVLDRADPQVAFAAFYENRGEVQRLATMLRREVDHIITPGPHSSARQWCVDKILDQFVEMNPDEAARLIQPAIGPSRSRSTFLFMSFPAIGLCRGLLRHRREVGADLWHSLMDEQGDGVTRRGDLAHLPFGVQRGRIIDPLQEHALFSARDDAAGTDRGGLNRRRRRPLAGGGRGARARRAHRGRCCASSHARGIRARSSANTGAMVGHAGPAADLRMARGRALDGARCF